MTAEAPTYETILQDLLDGLSKTMRKLDDTAEGLGTWDDSTEYIEYARGEIQKSFATAVKARAALTGDPIR